MSIAGMGICELHLHCMAIIIIIIIGASATTTTTASTFGLGSGPVFLSDVHCTGSEATLLDCRHTAIALGSYCTHNRDVGVRCEGEFKLMSY